MPLSTELTEKGHGMTFETIELINRRVKHMELITALVVPCSVVLAGLFACLLRYMAVGNLAPNKDFAWLFGMFTIVALVGSLMALTFPDGILDRLRKAREQQYRVLKDLAKCQTGVR